MGDCVSDKLMTEEQVVALRPLKDLDAKWAANDQAAINHTRNVYNSFKRL